MDLCLFCFVRPAEAFGPYAPGDECVCRECAKALGVEIAEEPEEKR